MKLYAIKAHDGPGAAAIRAEKLMEHLAHIEATLDRLTVAGPLHDEQGQTVGSLLVVKAEDEAAARSYLESDPYFKAGVWKAVDIAAFAAVAGDWVGGKTW